MTMTNLAIDIVTAENIDYRKLCIYIAKHQPSLLVHAAVETDQFNPSYDECVTRDIGGTLFKLKMQDLQEMKNLKSNGKIVSAIKLCRELTSVGLKPAKDFVDSL